MSTTTEQTIIIRNTQQVWVEWISEVKVSQEELEQIDNGELNVQDLWDRDDNQYQNDMWGGDEENYFEYEEK